MVEPAPLTLDDLSREAERMITKLDLEDAQPDGRVSPAPDARTVRYYQTLGLLDRPTIVGREARYGRRHVLQLVAVKALQAGGLPLAQVQERLYGRSNAELESLLSSVAETRRRRPAAVHSVRWREVSIEPGLRLMIEDGWSPRTSAETLEGRIRAALAALSESGGVK